MNSDHPIFAVSTSQSRDEWMGQAGESVRELFHTLEKSGIPLPLLGREEAGTFLNLRSRPRSWENSTHNFEEQKRSLFSEPTVESLSTQLVESISSWRESTVDPLTLHAGTDIFRTAAMFRAARMVANQLAEPTKEDREIQIRAVISGAGSSGAIDADRAPDSLVRSTIQAIGAILGLADELRFLHAPVESENPQSFPATCRSPHRFHSLSEILREEAQLGAVSDLLSGSYWVDHLTSEIAHRVRQALANGKSPHIPSSLPACNEGQDRVGSQATNEGWPGTEPFIRGPYPTMYCGKPWTIRQYAGFSGADETNAFFKNALADGQKGLSVAFDLPTHRGYDSDHPQATADVGKAGVSIDTVEDMKRVFDEIPLDSVSVSMTMNGAVLPIVAFFIVAAEETGIPPHKLSGTIQNDILKEYMVRNTYIYPPEPSMYLVSSIMSGLADLCPKFNSISVSGYHMHEAGATASQEIAYTLANGLAYVEEAERAGLDLETITGRMSFFWAQGMDFLTEVAKLRAARGLWSRLLKEKGIRSKKSLALRCHCQTSGWSLTRQDPVNNIIRTTLEAITATHGGTQSLHTNSFDEAVALPSDFAAGIARRTQVILAEESGCCDKIDPWGGSFHLEERTETLAKEALKLLEEVKEAGGMVSAISKGIPQRRIEHSAASRQARIDSGEERIVGINHLKTGEDLSPDPRMIDAEDLVARQTKALKRIREKRDDMAVAESLFHLRKSAENRQGDLLEKALCAARNRATLGEISAELEIVFGRHETNYTISSGVYLREMNEPDNEEELNLLAKRVREFSSSAGRRPRILVAKLGQDGHDRGAKVVAGAFSDFGFDVDIAPLFQTPEQVFRQAVDNDVHVVGISSLAGAHMSLVGSLLKKFKEEGMGRIRVVVGGIVPDCDREELLSSGVCSIFGPGSRLPQCALEILDAIEEFHADDRP